MSAENYFKNPDKCPECGSTNIIGGDFDPIKNFIYRDCHCEDCKIEWTEQFTLTGLNIK